MFDQIKPKMIGYVTNLKVSFFLYLKSEETHSENVPPPNPLLKLLDFLYHNLEDFPYFHLKHFLLYLFCYHLLLF